ncbi:MAG: hypothetical protein WAT17_02145 [Candidatus Saccharimonadales bacterium]
MTDHDTPTPQDIASLRPRNDGEVQDSTVEHQDSITFSKQLAEFMATEFDPRMQSPESFVGQYEAQYRAILGALEVKATRDYAGLVGSHAAAIDEIVAHRGHADMLAKQSHITGSAIYAGTQRQFEITSQIIEKASGQFERISDYLDPGVWELVQDNVRTYGVNSQSLVPEAIALGSSQEAQAVMRWSIGRQSPERSGFDDDTDRVPAARTLGHRVVTVTRSSVDYPSATTVSGSPWEFAGRDDERPQLPTISAPAVVSTPQDAPREEQPFQIPPGESAKEFRKRVTNEVRKATRQHKGLRAKLGAAKRVLKNN